MHKYSESFISPIGPIEVIASDNGVVAVNIGKTPDHSILRGNEHCQLAIAQLIEYFNGKRQNFDVSLDWSDASDFYQKVWNELTKIPFGKVISYQSIALSLGSSNLVRAVGQANGKNPIPIIVPCHRVIGKNGEMVGFALGVGIKKLLLALENPNERGIQASLF